MLGTMLVGAWLLIQQHCCSVYGDSGSRFRSAALVDPLMRRSPLEKNFMRFGRASPSSLLRDSRSKENFMRFGRPSIDPQITSNLFSPEDIYRQSNEIDTTSDKVDNFMKDGITRLRRAKENFMRFGRRDDDKGSEQIDEKSKRQQSNFMRFGRKDEPFESSESSTADLSDESEFVRKIRPKENFMRFGRDKERVVRNEKGKQDSFIRFGKSDGVVEDDYQDCDENIEKRKSSGGDNGFVRFGRGKEKFMRFGKSNDEVLSTPLVDKDKAILIRVARDQNAFMRTLRQNQQDKNKGFIRFGRSDRQKRETHKHKVNRKNSESEPNGVCKSSIVVDKPDPDCKDNSCKPLYLPWPFYYQPSLYSVVPNLLSTPDVSILPTTQSAHKPKRSRSGLQSFIRLG